MKRIVICLSVILALAAVICACGKGDGKDKNDGAGNVDGIVIAENGKCEYTVIYADGASELTRECATYLMRAISDHSGAAVKVRTDWVKDKSEIDENACEILVGDTNRGISVLAEGDDASIAISKSKLCISAKDSVSLMYAVGIFINDYVNASEDASVCVPKDLKISVNTAKNDAWKLYALPAMDGVTCGEYDLSTPTRYDGGSSKGEKEYVSVQYFTGAHKDGFESYVKELERLGFVNDSATEYQGRHVISMYHICIGREGRFTLTFNETNGSLIISQAVGFSADAN